MPGARASNYLRRTANRFLVHKCDYIRRQSTLVIDEDGNPILDEWDQKQYADSSITEEAPCLYAANPRQIITTDGVLNTEKPVLFMKNNITIGVGDLISNISTKSNKVLVDNARIETATYEVAMGESIMRVFTLSTENT